MNKVNSVIDHFQGRGIVTKTLIDNETGKVVGEVTDHNLIVKIGRSTLINMLAGNISTSVNKMAIGSGGTADLGANAFNPIPPVDGDTGLKNRKSIVSISSKNVETSATNPRVTFVAIFDCADVNSLVNECGLLFADGTTLFARHTFDTVSLKNTSNFSLQVSWTIEF